MKQYTIAAFDLDGTITKSDTLNHLIILTFGVLRFAKKIIALSLLIFLYKVGLVPNHVPKERLFKAFFGGMKEDTFNILCRNYSLGEIDKFVRHEAMKRISWHREQGHKLVIVSASLCNWIVPWAEKNGFAEVISTTAEAREGMLTGYFLSQNCYGKEKVRRFLERFPARQEYNLYVYGDSAGDAALLAIADYPFFKKFSDQQEL